MAETTFDPFADTIPLQEAETITTNWRNFIGPLVSSQDFIRAFYIPIEDIVNLGNYHSAIGVRAYLCLTVPDDPSTAKIVLVPVDARNKDIISVTTPKDELVHSTIYDLTQPCPQMCDFTSPLYES